VADTGKRTKGKQQADKAAPKLPQYAPIVFQGEPSRVRVPHYYKQKKQHRKSVLLFMVRWKGLEPLTP